MMYKKNYVLALKTGGKILREANDSVQLPFGYEYSILIKNLHGVRATAALAVNGTEIGTFVVPANGEIEVERFMKNGNMNQGNKFKFIERTDAVESARGIQVDDGLVRVEFKKEHISQPVIWYPQVYPTYSNAFTHSQSGAVIRSGGVSGSSIRAQNTQMTCNSSHSGPIAAETSVVGACSNDQGITVPGGISNQQFQIASWFPTEAGSEVLVLHLVGTHGRIPVPVTVDVRPICQTCHKRSKSGSQFCSRCGTGLQII